MCRLFYICNCKSTLDDSCFCLKYDTEVAIYKTRPASDKLLYRQPYSKVLTLGQHRLSDITNGIVAAVQLLLVQQAHSRMTPDGTTGDGDRLKEVEVALLRCGEL
jgi:hypothetical protein